MGHVDAKRNDPRAASWSRRSSMGIDAPPMGGGYWTAPTRSRRDSSKRSAPRLACIEGMYEISATARASRPLLPPTDELSEKHGAVLASRWCRARETADLAFPGVALAEPAFDSFFDERAEGPERTARAQRVLLDWGGPGTLVVATHQVNITALTGVVPSSGEGVVLKPSGGDLVVVGRVRP